MRVEGGELEDNANYWRTGGMGEQRMRGNEQPRTERGWKR